MTEQTASLELKAKLFRGFADPTRLSIMESLRNGEKSVGTIAEVIGQSQSNVSSHLSCLKECGLVVSRRDGKNIFYSIASERVLGLLRDGDLVINEVKDSICSCARYSR